MKKAIVISVFLLSSLSPVNTSASQVFQVVEGQQQIICENSRKINLVIHDLEKNNNVDVVVEQISMSPSKAVCALIKFVKKKDYSE